MGKRKKKGTLSTPPTEEPFSHNPFAALGGGKAVEEAAPSAGKETAKKAARSEPAVEKTKKGPARAVLRILRKGRGGKPVTQVTHLALSSDELKEWSKSLRRELGCGASVEGDTIVVQGDQRDRLEAALQKRGVRRISKG